MKDFEELFPLCRKYKENYFKDVKHHFLVMNEVSRKLNIPLEELYNFFYQGKIKMDCIKNEEEHLKNSIKEDN